MLAYNLTALPVTKGAYPKKLHEFHAKVLFSVQALESLGKLGKVNGFVRGTSDKIVRYKIRLSAHQK